MTSSRKCPIRAKSIKAQFKCCAIVVLNSIDRLNSTLAWQQLEVWINISFKFDKLCHATRLWHDVDSNLMLNLCKTQCIHYDNWSCISYLYPKRLVGLYPGSMLESVLSATTKLNSTFGSTIVLRRSLNTIKFGMTIELGLIQNPRSVNPVRRC